MSPLGWHCAIFLFLLLIPPLINNVAIGQFGQAPQDPKFDILLDTSTLWHRHQCADFENWIYYPCTPASTWWETAASNKWRDGQWVID
jgi:hypothetical protein